MTKRAYQTISVRCDNQILEIRLSRPDVKNAFNPVMIKELTRAFTDVKKDKSLRVIALSGEGGVFCSGGDLSWMKESLGYSRSENHQDAKRLYDLFAKMDQCKLPIVCAVENFALGGGVGLVSLADYVIAEADAKFSLSEVRVGLIPACIGPFVLRKIGESHCRALFLSGERFAASRALQIGLVHEVAQGGAALEEAKARVIRSILSASPNAVRTAKSFIRALTTLPPSKQGALAVKTLADIRVTKEAQEGLTAFLEKRPPRWQA